MNELMTVKALEFAIDYLTKKIEFIKNKEEQSEDRNYKIMCLWEEVQYCNSELKEIYKPYLKGVNIKL